MHFSEVMYLGTLEGVILEVMRFGGHVLGRVLGGSNTYSPIITSDLKVKPLDGAVSKTSTSLQSHGDIQSNTLWRIAESPDIPCAHDNFSRAAQHSGVRLYMTE